MKNDCLQISLDIFYLTYFGFDCGIIEYTKSQSMTEWSKRCYENERLLLYQ